MIVHVIATILNILFIAFGVFVEFATFSAGVFLMSVYIFRHETESPWIILGGGALITIFLNAYLLLS